MGSASTIWFYLEWQLCCLRDVQVCLQQIRSLIRAKAAKLGLPLHRWKKKTLESSAAGLKVTHAVGAHTSGSGTERSGAGTPGSLVLK